ncbi:MAG TPA: hypothetical protein VHZ07_03435 [Bryobacteraceae bacterium]|nr:hypothetical protein [Bryobacteraceae bacterium]
MKDLAGVRVLAFTRSRRQEIDEILRETFPAWMEDPVQDAHGEKLAFKYSGYCSEASIAIRGEYQIVPFLTGLFWNIEHSAIYKPSPELKGVARSLAMQARSQAVLDALSSFEEEFERLVRSATSQAPD